MYKARQGDTVEIQYIGTLDNGRVFENTTEQAPLIITLGNNQIFPALERHILGMAVGEVKNIVIDSEEAFGPRREENILILPREDFPREKELRIGQKISVTFTDNSQRLMLIIGIDETEATLDGNHSLAGCDLTFALRLDRIM